VLFAVSNVEIQNISAVIGQTITCACYSADSGVEWRWQDGLLPLLIYISGNILRLYASQFSVESAGGWHNLTGNVTSSKINHFLCYKGDGGPLIKRCVINVVAVAGIFLLL